MFRLNHTGFASFCLLFIEYHTKAVLSIVKPFSGAEKIILLFFCYSIHYYCIFMHQNAFPFFLLV